MRKTKTDQSTRASSLILVSLALASIAFAGQLTVDGFAPIDATAAAQACDGSTDRGCSEADTNTNTNTNSDSNSNSDTTITRGQADASTTEVPTELPAEALAMVKELDVKLRYFRAIGFHDRSNAQRESIVAIYEQHGLAIPDKYQP